MSSTGSSGRNDADDGQGSARPLRAYRITVRGREECTLAPVDPSDEERLCAWVTALEESFVSLDDVR